MALVTCAASALITGCKQNATGPLSNAPPQRIVDAVCIQGESFEGDRWGRNPHRRRFRPSCLLHVASRTSSQPMEVTSFASSSQTQGQSRAHRSSCRFAALHPGLDGGHERERCNGRERVQEQRGTDRLDGDQRRPHGNGAGDGRAWWLRWRCPAVSSWPATTSGC
jgi:hypothetical protein